MQNRKVWKLLVFDWYKAHFTRDSCIRNNYVTRHGAAIQTKQDESTMGKKLQWDASNWKEEPENTWCTLKMNISLSVYCWSWWRGFPALWVNAIPNFGNGEQKYNKEERQQKSHPVWCGTDKRTQTWCLYPVGNYYITTADPKIGEWSSELWECNWWWWGGERERERGGYTGH